MADADPTPSPLERLLTFTAPIVAPVTAISTLLFYFGYASSRAQYEYFGLDVDTIGLSTQDFVMRSPQPLLMPLLALALLGLVFTLAHAAVRRRIDAAIDAGDEAGAESRRELARIRRAALAIAVAGQAVLAAGVILLLTYGYLREWAPYPLVTPLVLALGAALVGYGRWIRALSGSARPTHRATSVPVWLVLGASVFWATATLAEWSGRGTAHYAALHLDRLPSVILDTQERLYLTSPHITETALQPAAEQTFRYRYRRLRLLIQGRDRLFLVPDTWSASNSTIVVPTNTTSVRVQFQFQNQRP